MWPGLCRYHRGHEPKHCRLEPSDLGCTQGPSPQESPAFRNVKLEENVHSPERAAFCYVDMLIVRKFTMRQLQCVIVCMAFVALTTCAVTQEAPIIMEEASVSAT